MSRPTVQKVRVPRPISNLSKQSDTVQAGVKQLQETIGELNQTCGCEIALVVLHTDQTSGSLRAAPVPLVTPRLGDLPDLYGLLEAVQGTYLLSLAKEKVCWCTHEPGSQPSGLIRTEQHPSAGTAGAAGQRSGGAAGCTTCGGS